MIEDTNDIIPTHLFRQKKKKKALQTFTNLSSINYVVLQL